jgi:hypothetical protein
METLANGHDPEPPELRGHHKTIYIRRSVILTPPPHIPISYLHINNYEQVIYLFIYLSRGSLIFKD